VQRLASPAAALERPVRWGRSDPGRADLIQHAGEPVPGGSCRRRRRLLRA
jgi:hypothetical protein